MDFSRSPLPKANWKRKKARRIQKTKSPESPLQSFTDTLLKLKNIFFLRIPDVLYRLIGSGRLRAWEGKILSDSFKGVFDSWPLIPISDTYAICRPLELKSDKGRLSPSQQKLSKIMPVTICKTEEEVQEAIRELEGTADKLREYLNETP